MNEVSYITDDGVIKKKNHAVGTVLSIFCGIISLALIVLGVLSYINM